MGDIFCLCTGAISAEAKQAGVSVIFICCKVAEDEVIWSNVIEKQKD